MNMIYLSCTKEKNMHDIKRYIAKPLVLIGALNWGLVGMFNFDLVAALFGYSSVMSRIIYSLVGIAAVVCIIMMFMPMDDKTRNRK